ncbi:hypothetical protein IEQ34_005161 [Dendrobium chrysotoxum]|uniref:Uncharacterized protein n=1 Tax=Dendrobium chrysotoxum TaxID=161865 RepID=A0AAV7HAN5_DENCH|nr:hypothetical protein IEQ34_005161 [Dendrobium chrysotoxum]
MSILPKRYSLFDWKPEPEALSRERVSSCPLLRTLARPSPQVMSKSLLKFPAAAVETVAASRVQASIGSNSALAIAGLQTKGGEELC